MVSKPIRLLYLCLSPTFGMHQYTADLANRMADVGYDVHVIASANLTRDRYSPKVRLHTPISNRTTGFSGEALDINALRKLQASTFNLQPDLLHITAPHLWNPFLLRQARRRIPALHTLHDLDPHPGTPFGSLIPLWNRLVINQSDHILVHARRYRQRLIAQGLPPDQITATPLLHLFLSDEAQATVDALPDIHTSFSSPGTSHPEPETPFILFFGRFLPYKGIDTLLTAYQRLTSSSYSYSPSPSSTPAPRLLLAGPGNLTDVWNDALPPGVELRNHLIPDTEAIDLFRCCSVLALPYTQATQSALIAAAYYFSKPVIVSDAGALPEYVIPGETGWVAPAGDAPALTAVLNQALSDPARLAKMGANGRIWYEHERRNEHGLLLALYRQLSSTPSPEVGALWAMIDS